MDQGAACLKCTVRKTLKTINLSTLPLFNGKLFKVPLMLLEML